MKRNGIPRKALFTLAGALIATGAVFLAGSPARAEEEAEILSRRRQLLETVRQEGPAAADKAVEALDDPVEIIALTGAHLIADFEPPVRPALEAGLAHENVAVRLIMIRALEKHDLVAEYWTKIISDEAPRIQRLAQLSLLEEYILTPEGDLSERTIESFGSVFQDSSATIRARILEMLATHVDLDEKGWEIIEQATEDPEEEISRRATEIITDNHIERMDALLREREPGKLVEEYGEKDFLDWTDSEKVQTALFLRGRAHYNLGNGEKARADLERSIEISPKRRVLRLLGDTWRNRLDDPEKALETYIRAIETPVGFAGHVLYGSIMSAAGLLRDEQKHEEALALYERVNPEGMSGHWGYRFNTAIAATLEEQGRTDEAIARYRMTLEMSGLSEGQEKRLEELIAELEEN